MTEKALTCQTANRVASLVCRQPGMHFEEAVARVIEDAKSTELDVEIVREIAWNHIAEHWAVVV